MAPCPRLETNSMPRLSNKTPMRIPWDSIAGTPPPSRRGSESASSSSCTALSAFRESLSSDDSGSDEDLELASSLDCSLSGSERAAIAKTVAKLVTNLSIALPPQTIGTTIDSLLGIVEHWGAEARSLVAQAFTTSNRAYQSLFFLSDVQTPIHSTLRDDTSSARMIRHLMTDVSFSKYLSKMVRRSAYGASGVRFAIQHSKHKHILSSWTVAEYVRRILRSPSSTPPSARFHAISLWELVVRTCVTAEPFLNYQDVFRQCLNASQPAEETVVLLQLVLSCTSVGSGRQISELLQHELRSVARVISNAILDSRASGIVRAMGLAALRALVVSEPTVILEWDCMDAMVELCVGVLLWRTVWQHDLRTEEAEQGVGRLRPHDDAYTVLCYLPKPKLRLVFGRTLNQMARESTTVDALLSLIVDRSATNDPHWPSLLTILLEAGLFQVLLTTAATVLPDGEDRTYRTVFNMKIDALVALRRIFEQVQAKDLKHIEPNTFVTLTALVENRNLPLTIQRRALDALSLLNQTTMACQRLFQWADYIGSGDRAVPT
ncbi:hypothetical protein FRB99_004901 [Tulasnella sp. 403]|nr:hypothetical protein FRB99_004901 [Tulasnella sp. 403]